MLITKALDRNKKVLKSFKETMSLTRLVQVGFFNAIELPANLKPVERELKLHRAVLDKSLIDCFSSNKQVKRKARKWPCLNNDNFIVCCEFALFEPAFVKDVFFAYRKILRGKNAKMKGFTKKVKEDG